MSLKFDVEAILQAFVEFGQLKRAFDAQEPCMVGHRHRRMKELIAEMRRIGPKWILPLLEEYALIQKRRTQLEHRYKQLRRVLEVVLSQNQVEYAESDDAVVTLEKRETLSIPPQSTVERLHLEDALQVAGVWNQVSSFSPRKMVPYFHDEISEPLRAQLIAQFGINAEPYLNIQQKIIKHHVPISAGA